jgi:hypothetical protein
MGSLLNLRLSSRLSRRSPGRGGAVGGRADVVHVDARDRRVARWDGGAWTTVDAGTSTHFSAVWQTSDGVVRLFGDAGAILRR